jgi:MFS transporter, DHA2 family, multidrug resistance protein
LINIMQQGLGGTVGIAVMATFLEHRTLYHVQMLDQQQVLTSLSWTHIWAPIGTFLAEAGETGSMLGLKSLGLVQRQLILESTMMAYQDCFLLMTALCVVVMPLVFFIRRAPGRVL